MGHSDDRIRSYIGRIREGTLDIDTVIGPLSTSESTTLMLGAGRADLLAKSRYSDLGAAWRRLDEGQRRVVLDAWESG